MGTADLLAREEINEALDQLPHWRYRLGGLDAVFKLPTSRATLDLMARIGDLAEHANHHPDVDWRYNLLFVRLISHDAGSQVTVRDIELAKQISAAAQNAGAAAEPGLCRGLELAIDTDDPGAIAGTWRAALGYRADGAGNLRDPHGRLPNVWFQKTETPNPNRIHVDVNVGFPESGRILDEVAATGATLNQENAPAFVVVTDTQGNRLCVCTEEGRED